MKKTLMFMGFLLAITIGYGQNYKGYKVTALDTLESKNALHIVGDATLESNIGSKTFVSGFTGNGWRLIHDGDASLTVDNLTVRKAARFYELLIEKIRAVNGGIVISSANAEIDSVAIISGGYRIFPVDSAISFVTNDISRCQTWTGTALRYYCGLVTGTGNKYFDLQIIDGEDIPAIGDELVQFGNTTDTARQGLLYLTASDDGAPYLDLLDQVNSTDLTDKTKVRIGKLDGIVSENYGPLSGYGIWARNAVLEGDLATENGSVSTQFAVLDGKINAKISESEVDSLLSVVNDSISVLSTKTTSNTSEINMLADQISSKVSQSTFETFQTSNTTAINNAKSDAISAAATDATDKVNAIQVGGTNLLSNSGWLSNTGGWTLFMNCSRNTTVTLNGANSILSNQSGLSSPGYRGARRYQAYNPSTDAAYYTASIYVYSADISTIDVGCRLEVYACNGTTRITNLGVSDITPTENNVFKRFSFTFLKSSIPSNTTNFEFYFWVRQNGVVYFVCPQLEEGNKATGWSPAPEDLAKQSDLTTLTTRVTTAESDIIQNATDITLKVNTSTYTSDQSAVNSRLDDAEASIQVNADNITSKVNTSTFSSFQTSNTTAINNAKSEAVDESQSYTDDAVDDVESRLGVQLMPNTWTVGSGSTGIYTTYGTSNRVYGISPLNGIVVLWEGVSDGSTSNNDGGFRAYSVTVDNTKTYRYSVFVKRQSTATGTLYFGPFENTVCNLNTTTLNNNPYFWYSTTLPEYDKWYLLIGYVYPYGLTDLSAAGGLYDCETGEEIALGNWRSFNWASDSVAGFRSFVNGDSSTDNKSYFWSPRIDLMDGNEPSVQELMGTVETPYTSQQRANLVKTYAESIVEQSDSAWTAGFKIIGVDGYTREGKTEITVDGITVYNGGITVKNNAGTDVLSADTNGNLTLSGTVNATAGSFTGTVNADMLTANSGTIGGFSISGNGLVHSSGGSYIITRNSTSSVDARIGAQITPAYAYIQPAGYFNNTQTSFGYGNAGLYAAGITRSYGYTNNLSSDPNANYAAIFRGDVAVMQGTIKGSVVIPSNETYSLSDSGSEGSKTSIPAGYYLYLNDNITANRHYYLPNPASYQYGECIIVTCWNEYDVNLYPLSGDYINGTTSKKIRLSDPGSSVTLRATMSGTSPTENNCWMIISFGGSDQAFE